MASGADQTDFFDLLPDPVLLLILNRVADIKTLLRCRCLCRRLDANAPHSDSLLLRVDRVIYDGGAAEDSLISSFFNSLLTSFHHLFDDPIRFANSPTRILRGFDTVKSLRIELPDGDLRLEEGVSVRWAARFGGTLQSCVILASGGGGGMKTRVVWTISVVIAASARHHMAADIVDERRSLSHLVISDRENEGTVVVDKDGLREFRERIAAAANGSGAWWRDNRTTVPAVGIRMRHEPRLELASGRIMEGATLVVVRPLVDDGGERRSEAEEALDDEALAAEAFGSGGVYAEAAEKLLKNRSYILEINSF